MTDHRRIAVLGATGYIGGRLIPRLLEQGYAVRAIGRSIDKLSRRPWAGHERVELAQADAMDKNALTTALRNCDTAFYLVHSMAPGATDFEQRDKQAAQIMVQTAADAVISRIVYLGGLGDPKQNLSAHLRSRMEVGEILASGPVPLTWFRAAMIIGSGSGSFEILRYLVDRLPVMITPSWVQSLCQPIAVTNVLDYLVGALSVPETIGRSFDIGGPDILSYRELFDVYAKVAGLRKRIIIPVPVLTPTLSSYWIQMVTPVPSSLSRPLAEGLRNKVVCRENDIRDLIPTRLLSAEEGIARALDRTIRHAVETCWSDAGAPRIPEWIDCGDAHYAGGTVLEAVQSITLDTSPAHIWNTLRTLGGERGWLFADWLWALRGFMDQMLGGTGSRRGRRHPSDIRVGDALDFWRVLEVVPETRLRLLAEMKVPGDALLQFDLLPESRGTTITLRARFLPHGLWGIIYWHALTPLHWWLFRGMLRGAAKATGANILRGPISTSTEGAQCKL